MKTVSERFWEKVTKTDTCWRWIGGGTRSGYGQFHAQGRGMPAHRWAYESLVGPIPDGLQLDHLCRNKACVNPSHLEPVTNQENILRGYRSRTHCVHGHEFTPENSYLRPGGLRQGVRHCRECKNAIEKRSAASLRATGN